MRTLFTPGLLCIMLSCAARADESARLRPPEVWLCPPAGKLFELLKQEADWDFSRQRIAGLKLYIGVINRAEHSDLVALAALIRKNKFKVAVECGGTLNHDWQDEAGEKSAQVELAKLEKWYRAGGKVDYLDIDGPVRRLMGHAGWGKDPAKKFVSHARCAQELMDYLAAVRKAHPDIRFFLLTNFPNWGYRQGVSYHGRGPCRQDYGDYHEVITTVLKAAREARVEIAGATVDNPYEYAVGSQRSATVEDPSSTDWIARIRTYEDFCRSNGLEFNLIINSAKGGNTSDRLFFEQTLDMLTRYEKAGGRPDRYFVQSWYDHPTKIVPETEDYSMTALTKAVLTQLRRSKHNAEQPRGKATQGPARSPAP